MSIVPVSVENTLKLLSQKPQATRNLLSTVVTKQLDLILIFWLKLSPRCLFRAGLELFDDCAASKEPNCQLLLLYKKIQMYSQRTGSMDKGRLVAVT